MNNKDFRWEIVRMVYAAQDGHIPSAFSVVDILALLYAECLRVNCQDPKWPERDYFILSKGHGRVALYVILRKHGFLTDEDIQLFCKEGGILGEHPDCTKVPGVEASTGSLGHGFPFAVGIALGLRIRGMKNGVYVLVGDGECHEGTVWEAANVANDLQLGNLDQRQLYARPREGDLTGHIRPRLEAAGSARGNWPRRKRNRAVQQPYTVWRQHVCPEVQLSAREGSGGSADKLS